MVRKRRLHIPTTLVVVIAGSAATAGMVLAACEEAPMPDPIDAGQLSKIRDAGLDSRADSKASADGSVLADASHDAAPDARPDARVLDAYVPPDTPHG